MEKMTINDQKFLLDLQVERDALSDALIFPDEEMEHLFGCVTIPAENNRNERALKLVKAVIGSSFLQSYDWHLSTNGIIQGGFPAKDLVDNESMLGEDDDLSARIKGLTGSGIVDSTSYSIATSVIAQEMQGYDLQQVYFFHVRWPAEMPREKEVSLTHVSTLMKHFLQHGASIAH